MEENKKLRQRMIEAGFTQTGLAQALNAYLWQAGEAATVSERTVRYWLTGRTRCPYPRQREALEAVFECSIVELGFEAPHWRQRAQKARSEDPVQRRDFLTAATGTTAAAAVPFTAIKPTIGTSDVIRLRNGLDTLPALDQQKGGHNALEHKALSGADETLALLKRGTATQRIRHRLYEVGAGYMCAAAWSAIDDHSLSRGRRHLDQALCLARMANNPTSELQVWNLYSSLGYWLKDYTLAVDAGRAAQATFATRQDPFFASLAHARTAVSHAPLGDHQSAKRSLGHAQEALAKADLSVHRPTWSDFYGPGELHSMGQAVHNDLGEWQVAEAHGHQSLALTPDRFRRNRAMQTTRNARAQLHQGDVDQACATASDLFTLMAGEHIPGRLRSQLDAYNRDLLTVAPKNPTAHDWTDRYRTEWSRA